MLEGVDAQVLIKRFTCCMFREHHKHEMVESGVYAKPRIHAGSTHFASNVETLHTRMNAAEHTVRDGARKFRDLLRIDRRIAFVAE